MSFLGDTQTDDLAFEKCGDRHFKGNTYTTWPDKNTEKSTDAEGELVMYVKLEQWRVYLVQACCKTMPM